MLVRYLGEVVVAERDLGKARAVVRWFGVVVGDVEGGGEGKGKGKGKLGGRGVEEWKRAVVRAAREGVGGGCRVRGIPEVGFVFPWDEDVE